MVSSKTGTEDHLHQICQLQDYGNKDRLSENTILLLQQKSKLGRTKPSTGPHAGRGVDMADLSGSFHAQSKTSQRCV